MCRTKMTFYKIVCFVAAIQAATMSSIDDFYPSVKGNLTKVTWAHAVNSKDLLTQALATDVMMLEADVSMGKVEGGADSTIPIMHHPQDNDPTPPTSDLSLQIFLQLVQDFNKDHTNQTKGVKLDFKSADAIPGSIQILELANVTCPLWLNADILKGPNSPKPQPVDPKALLTDAIKGKKYVYSLGWTTQYGGDVKNVSYATAEIDEMIKTIRDNKYENETITFAVRAGIAAQSLAQMQALKSAIDQSTLTVWSGVGDDVDVDKLRAVILDYGVGRVYVDVPEELRERLNLSSSAGRVPFSIVLMFSALALAMAMAKAM